MRTFIEIVIDALALLALISIGMAAIVTGADVVLRHTIGSPVRGLVDLTQLAVMYSAFAGIAYAFAQRAHVSVTLLTEGLSPRVNRVLAALWWLGGAVLMALLAWAAWGQMQRVMSYGDVSQNIRIPMQWYWLPVVTGLALSALGSLWACFETLRGAADPSEDTV